MTDQAEKTVKETQEAAESAKDTASDTATKGTEATSGASGVVSDIKDQVTGAFSDAVREILTPAIQQMSQQAARQAADYAKEEGPRIVKEQVLPRVMEATGAEKPGDLVKQGVGKVGEAISDSGGITGIAGKLMSKMGGGKGGGQATGYGQKRRMPVQQDVFISVPVEDAYRAWTEYKRWTEYMHRANQVDPQIEEADQGDEPGGSARLTVTEKMWGFKRPFTAEVVSQVPNEHIRWKSTQGTKHVGIIAFHGIAPRLTLISVNIDHAPSGPIEKISRGARFDKRAIRADLHRFKGWVEHKSEDELEEMEGWLGTIEDGQITEPHEGEESGRQGEEGSEQDREEAGQGGEEGQEGGSEDEQEDQEDDQEIEQGEDDTTEIEPGDEEEYEEEEGEEEEEEVEEEEEEPEPEPEPKPAARKPVRRKRPATTKS